ncbi:MAG: hypothetical protein AB1898_27715 [Acidobacteriota bacterium]
MFATRIEKNCLVAPCSDPGLAGGVNVYDGHVTWRAAAESLGADYKPVPESLP